VNNEEVRSQVASVMRRAAIIVGSDKELAKRLGVTEPTLSAWMHRQADCPIDNVQNAVDVILAHLDQLDGARKT
jgi:DNA-binding transcriptional regulator YdaS (Cro superfamily)